MGFRTFTDRDKRAWEIRPVSRTAWEFHPVGDNRERPRSVAAPGYEEDPYELSQEELTRLFEASTPQQVRERKSPFKE